MHHVIEAESKLYEALMELKAAADKCDDAAKYSLIHFKCELLGLLEHDNGEAGFRPFVRSMEREAEKRRSVSFS